MHKLSSVTGRTGAVVAGMCALPAFAIVSGPGAHPHAPLAGLAWALGVVTLYASLPYVIWVGRAGGFRERTTPRLRYGLLALSVILVFLDAGFLLVMSAR